MKYFLENILHVIGITLASTFFTFLFFPALMNLESVKGFLSGTKKETFIAVTALVLFLVIYSWPRAQNFWERYKNVWKLEKPVFTYADGIVLFVIFSSTLIALFQLKSIPNLSSEFKVFAGLNAILILLWFLSSYFWKKQNLEKKGLAADTYSLSDEPIQFTEQDLLGRGKFIESLYQQITELPFADSFVFGLYGGWGEGKTSTINLLKSKINENDKFLAVSFDPWHFKDEEAILSAFYKQIEQAITQKFIFPGLKKTFARYQKLIFTGLSQAGIKLDFSFVEESLEETRKRIESYITRTDRKVVIFVDDIDRLSPSEVLLVFKLVRLNAKFANTIFVLSFDPIVIQNCLEKYIHADPAFLEKIVQKPVCLPAIEQVNIDHFLEIHMNRLFDKTQIPSDEREKFEEDFSFIYQSHINKLFKTLRHAKRFLNGLRSTLPLIKSEVNLYDFIIIEVIRIFYPRVFDDIWKYPWFYIPLNWSDTTYVLSPFTFGSKEEEKYLRIREHIESLIKSEEEGEVLRELLKTIFFVEIRNAFEKGRTDHSNLVTHYRAEKRITHPEPFKKYFMLNVSPSEISDEFVETIVDSWNSAGRIETEDVIEKTIFSLHKERKLLDFFKRLIVFKDKIERDVAPSIIKVIYRNADKFSKEVRGNFWDSEYDKSMALLLSLISHKIDKAEIQAILEEVVTQTPSFPFAVGVVLSCKREKGRFYDIYESQNIEKLQNKLASRLEKYFVEENRDIFEELPEKRDWAFVLYQWATNWGTVTGENKRIVNGYVFSLIKNDARRFIKFLMSHERTEVPYFDLNGLGQAYDLVELKKLGEKFRDDRRLSKEEKALIKVFLDLCSNQEIKEEREIDKV